MAKYQYNVSHVPESSTMTQYNSGQIIRANSSIHIYSVTYIGDEAPALKNTVIATGKHSIAYKKGNRPQAFCAATSGLAIIGFMVMFLTEGGSDKESQPYVFGGAAGMLISFYFCLYCTCATRKIDQHNRAAKRTNNDEYVAGLLQEADDKIDAFLNQNVAPVMGSPV